MPSNALSRRRFNRYLVAPAALLPSCAACVKTELTPLLAGATPPAARAAGLVGLRHEVDGLPIHSLAPADPPPAAGPPVVLVHGLALSGRYMLPTAEQLVRRVMVRVPDLPGFGDSGKPDRVLDVPELADALAAWLRHVVRKPVTLLGNSFGCQIIVDLAARHPELVHAAVLQGPTTPPGERTWLQQFIRWRQNAKFNPPELGDIAWADYEKCGIPRALMTFHYSLVDPVEEKLPLIRAPTLVVRGEKDPICRQDWAEEVTRRLPRGELTIIPEVAHTLCYTAPVQLADAAMDFLSGLKT